MKGRPCQIKVAGAENLELGSGMGAVGEGGVAVKELITSYYIGETLLFMVSPQ